MTQGGGDFDHQEVVGVGMDMDLQGWAGGQVPLVDGCGGNGSWS